MKTNLIVLKPVFTEKTLVQQEAGKYAFWVKREATKNQILASFETVFGIKPLNINTVLVKGKMKTNYKTRLQSQKQTLKKAIHSYKTKNPIYC